MNSGEHAALARVEIAQREDVCVIEVSGELDISNVGKLRDAAYDLPNHGFGLVVDLTRTRFIDSTTVGLLFELRAGLSRRRQALRVVCGAGSNPRRLLEVTAFPREALADDDVASAIASIRAELAPAATQAQ
jgi:anti-anti-sigma factor